MLTIGDVLAQGPDAAPALSNHFERESSDSFAAKLNESYAANDAQQTTTTDNIPEWDHSQPLNKPKQPSEGCPTPEVSTEQTNIPQTDEQTASNEATAPPDEIQLIQNGENCPDGDVESNGMYKLTQLLALLEAGKVPRGLEQAGAGLQSETVLTGEVAGVKGGVVLPDGSVTLSLKGAPNETTNDSADALQATIITAKGIGEQNITAESSGNGSGETAAIDGKTATLGILNSTGSQNQLPSDAIIVASEPLADSGKTGTISSGQLITEEQPLLSQGQKTANESFINAQDLSFDSQSVFGQNKNQKLADDAAGPASRITGNNQQGQIITELSDGNKQQDTGVTIDSLLQRLNINQAQINNGQTKNQGGSASNNADSAGLQQLISQSNAPMPGAEESAFSQATKTAVNVEPGTLSSSIGEQILASVNGSLAQPDRQITIQLNPPELGKVSIRFEEQQEQLTGLLEVDRAQTRAQLQQELPQIVRSLADSGIQVKRIEVVLSDTDQSQQQAFREQSLPDGSFQQQGFAQGSGSDNSYSDEWLMNDSGYEDFSQPQQMLATDSSINVLV